MLLGAPVEERPDVARGKPGIGGAPVECCPTPGGPGGILLDGGIGPGGILLDGGIGPGGILLDGGIGPGGILPGGPGGIPPGGPLRIPGAPPGGAIPAPGGAPDPGGLLQNYEEGVKKKVKEMSTFFHL